MRLILAIWLALSAVAAPPLFRAQNVAVDTAFSPDDLPGLALWLDADDSSTLTLSGSVVDEWRDKSGNGRHFTGSGSSRPALLSAAYNGLDAVSFDGVDDTMSTPDTTLRTNTSIWIVATKTSEPFPYHGPLLQQDQGGLLSSHLGAGVDPNWYQSFYGTTRINFGNVTSLYTIGDLFVVEINRTGSTISGTLNNTAVGSGTATAGAPSTGWWLAKGVGALYCPADFVEIVQVDNPTAEDRANLLAYFYAKWGITP